MLLSTLHCNYKPVRANGTIEAGPIDGATLLHNVQRTTDNHPSYNNDHASRDRTPDEGLRSIPGPGRLESASPRRRNLRYPGAERLGQIHHATAFDGLPEAHAGPGDDQRA